MVDGGGRLGAYLMIQYDWNPTMYWHQGGSQKNFSDYNNKKCLKIA